jgi:hypothetical protein
VQLNLNFLELPNPTEEVWDNLDEAQRLVALDVLARLIGQAAQPGLSAEGNNDD